MIEAGHRSIKIFMTYDRVRLLDEQVLDVMMVARKYGALVCVHAENHGMIKWMSDRLVARGYVEPKFHGVSHPRVCEIRGFRAPDPVLAVAGSAHHAVPRLYGGRSGRRPARPGRRHKVFAETCPPYLFLTAEDLDRPGLEGQMDVQPASPLPVGSRRPVARRRPRRHPSRLPSDHAPYRYDATGKLSSGPASNFKQIANGLPGLETRLHSLFNAMVSQGRSTLEKFVELHRNRSAKIYGLHPQKGAIAVGADADIAIWDPEHEVMLSDEGLHDNVGYNPFAWDDDPRMAETVLRRGETVISHGQLCAEPGSGRLQLRECAPSMRPSGQLSPEFDPARNFARTSLSCGTMPFPTHSGSFGLSLHRFWVNHD